ncbi:MAG: hypothetical protein NTY35_05350 [Planctomycetota bacterium]|nr:hypothetical protein [Planctomycetota bacterium]
MPVAIFNNQGGADAAALKRFGEPAWNNPVVRFLDGEGHDLIPRREGVWSEAAVVDRIVAALEAARCRAPRWLELARIGLRPTDPQRAVFTMPCFWEGQQRLGALDGVIDARPGFLEGREVVDVQFDGARVKLADLARRAGEMECASAIHVARTADLDVLPGSLRERARVLDGDVRPAGPGDDLRRLKAARDYDLLPLTRAQAVRANAELAASGSVRAGTLTPRQEELRRRIAAADSGRFAGLVRPEAALDLARHEAEVRARLDG